MALLLSPSGLRAAAARGVKRRALDVLLLLLLLLAPCARGWGQLGPAAFPISVPRRSTAAACEELVANASAPAPEYCCVDTSTDKLHTFFRAEFGWEFGVLLPLAYAAFRSGRLGPTRGCGPVGSLYFFAPQHTDVADCARRWTPNWAVGCGQVEHSGAMLEDALWRPPPLRAHFRDLPTPLGLSPPGGPLLFVVKDLPTPRGLSSPGGPLVFVMNKYSVEWNVVNEGGWPRNFIPVAPLLEIFALLHSHGLRVAYSRTAAFVEQGNADSPKELGEYEAIARDAPYVHTLRSLAVTNAHLNYNELQMRVLAHARHVITVQGGPAWTAAPFAHGGDLIVLHKAGKEQDAPGGEYQTKMPRLGGAAVTVVRSDEELLALVRTRALLWSLE